jgi:hypothetical protein
LRSSRTPGNFLAWLGILFLTNSLA